MSNDSLTNLFDEANYISIYSRAHAIEDGFLIDVSTLAKESGFTVPVAVTAAVWDRYVFWTEADDDRQTLQDTNGRLWDVLSMFKLAITCSKGKSDLLYYKLKAIPRGGRGTTAKLITLKGVISGGDDGEPVMTIMLPEED
jgi:hypothetical protein